MSLRWTGWKKKKKAVSTQTPKSWRCKVWVTKVSLHLPISKSSGGKGSPDIGLSSHSKSRREGAETIWQKHQSPADRRSIGTATAECCSELPVRKQSLSWNSGIREKLVCFEWEFVLAGPNRPERGMEYLFQVGESNWEQRVTRSIPKLWIIFKAHAWFSLWCPPSWSTCYMLSLSYTHRIDQHKQHAHIHMVFN